MKISIILYYKRKRVVDVIRRKNQKNSNYRKAIRLTADCRDCLKATGGERALRTKYGLTLASRQKLIDDQNGICKLCNGLHQRWDEMLQVDHDHITKVIRGMLCLICNTMLKERMSARFFINVVNISKQKDSTQGNKYEESTICTDPDVSINDHFSF